MEKVRKGDVNIPWAEHPSISISYFFGITKDQPRNSKTLHFDSEKDQKPKGDYIQGRQGKGIICNGPTSGLNEHFGPIIHGEIYKNRSARILGSDDSYSICVRGFVPLGAVPKAQRSTADLSIRHIELRCLGGWKVQLCQEHVETIA